MNILVTGGNGQLGSELKSLSTALKQFNFLFTDVDSLDITKEDAVNRFFENNRIDICINCAAYTAVDQAESDKAIATLLNETAVGILAQACEKNNAKLIQISTDFVFNGKGYQPYKEDHAIDPISFYGVSKAKGESKALTANGIVVRTSWLYSSYGNNFVKTMIRLGTERDELGIISDQIGTPTYAKDLAKAILTICENKDIKGLKGIYHYSNEGVASWYDFATAIFEIANIDCKTNAIPTEAYPTPATRPHYSVMNKSKIKAAFSLTIPHWRESLSHCIHEMNN